jgi:hypothetical protein
VTAANAIMNLRTMVFPPFVARSTGVLLIVVEFRLQDRHGICGAAWPLQQRAVDNPASLLRVTANFLGEMFVSGTYVRCWALLPRARITTTSNTRGLAILQSSRNTQITNELVSDL